MEKLIFPVVILGFVFMSWIVEKLKQKQAEDRRSKRPRGQDAEMDEEDEAYEAQAEDIKEFLQQIGVAPQEQQKPRRRPTRQQPAPQQPKQKQHVNQRAEHPEAQRKRRGTTQRVKQHATHGVKPVKKTKAEPSYRNRGKKSLTQKQPTSAAQPDNPLLGPRLQELPVSQRAIVLMELLGPSKALRKDEDSWV